MAMKKGKRRLSVDFSGVESGGKAVPDGVYEVEVVEITEEESSEGNPYLKWKFRIGRGPAQGARLYDNTSLQPQALWRLKGLLEILGEEVPDSAMDLDLSEYLGKTLSVVVANETYQGKERPKIAQYGGNSTEAKEDDDEETFQKFKVGQKVKFVDQKKTYKGKIATIEGDTATVETSDGEEWELNVSDLTAA